MMKDNVLITSMRRAVISDFGCAQMITDISQSIGQMTTTANLKGTCAFWSPELLKGMAYVRQTKESDVWAFGMTIYVRDLSTSPAFLHLTPIKELISRQRPFGGSSELQILQAIIQGTTPPFPTRPDIATGSMQDILEKICQRCWTADPARRPTMRDIISDLRHESLLLQEHRISESPIPGDVMSEPELRRAL